MFCNGNCHGNWTRQQESKSWTRLIAFLYSRNTIWKVMNPLILPPAMIN